MPSSVASRRPDDDAVSILPAGAAAEIAGAVVLSDLPAVILVAENETRAEAIARLAAAFDPDACVIHLPASDALPGDAAPPSAGNVGLRVAALRALRLATTAEPTPRILLVISAAASAVRYARPEAFDEAPPVLAIGAAIDTDAFAARAEALGYAIDDRVDEPGEIAIRGGVIDLYPADRSSPVRFEHADGRITAVRAYYPLTQLTTEDIAEVTIGRASEPPRDDPVPITGHFPHARLIHEGAALDRRERFLALATDGAPRRHGLGELIDQPVWIAGSAGSPLAFGAIHAPPPRFVEQRDPARGFRRFAKAVLDDRRIVIAGAPRDLRFLSRRLKLTDDPAASLREAAAAPVGTIHTVVAPVERGLAIDDLVVVAAADLLGSRARLSDDVSGVAPVFADAELHVGDVIVHEDHGIGRIAGVEHVGAAAGMGDGDGVVIDYAKGARRIVPVAEAGRIWRYGADADAVTLDTLDGSSWLRRRSAIDAAIAESARELTELARARDALTTDPIVPPPAEFERFAAGFAFTPTPDQIKAVEAVRGDLASGRPMDRLVIGDVGYGKTEVALRAAALVALSGRQVAVVAPTTVLARQHLDTFRQRFAGTGRAVAGLSRTATPAERKTVRAGLADGTIAVVVGTTAVAGKGIAFADLGLVVIDEEQRFGAAAKAKLRALGAGHVLTMSATPIPRTLQSAMIGLQATSVIATPPARRQPIRTTIAAFDDAAVRKALLRERARGGQSFFVVPRIADIDPIAAKLARLVPELAVVVAHGKLAPDALDDAMVRFATGHGDVLLATNIIEAGLDVPRANTMIVHHADRFGLSQLHQLRGRVGRSGRRGQILLLTDGDVQIAESTVKRLRTLQAFDQLGAGFAISARDLDMRGAGDLLGEDQAGHMKLIGVDLYQHLLAHALRKLRGEAVDRWQPNLNLGVSGRLPDDWIPELDLRLSAYGRLAHFSDVTEIDRFEAELEDRFGPLPVEAAQVIEVARIGALAVDAGIRQIDAGPAAIAFTPVDSGRAPPGGLDRVEGRWLLRERIDDPAARLDRIRDLLGDIID